jgi:hypothetical protein
MTPIEHDWPPEMLAGVFPEKYGHLVLNWPAHEEPPPASRYTVDCLLGGDAWLLGCREAGSMEGSA